MKRRYVFTGGGTGGHVVPNLAVIRLIQEREPESEILYVGLANGPEAAMAKSAQIAFAAVNAKPHASPRRLRAFLPFVFALVTGVLRAVLILARFRPNVVVATGGYVSVPTVLAAALLRRPVFLHEQNVKPGKANLFLARFATKVGVSFDSTASWFPKQKTVVTGYPLRKRITEADRAAARLRLKITDATKVAFVVGGSMGSRSINRAVVDGLKQILADDRVCVIHSTGLFDLPSYHAYNDTATRLGSAGLGEHIENRYIMKRFFENVEDAYAACDLVVSRAGAGTLMEIAAMRKPALLIPKGDGADAHQLSNALSMKELGAADIILEELYEEDGESIARVHGDQLARRILALLEDGDRLEDMARSTGGLVRTDAPERIFDEIGRLAAGAAAESKKVLNREGVLVDEDGRVHEILFSVNSMAYSSTADVKLARRGQGERAFVRRFGATPEKTEFVLVPRQGTSRVNGTAVPKSWTTLNDGDVVEIGDNRFQFKTSIAEVETPVADSGFVSKVVVTGLGTFFSRVVGLLRETVLAAGFGAGRVMDIFAASLNAANLLRRIFAENAVDSAFLPAFLFLQKGGRKEEASRLFRTLLTVSIVVTGLATVLGIVTAPYWLPYIVVGFAKKGMTEDTVALTRVMMPYLVLITVASILAAALKAFNRFGLASWSNVMFSFGIIAGSFLYPVMGVTGLGVGVLLGGLGQILMQVPPFLKPEFRKRHGISFAPSLGIGAPGMRKVRQTAPLIVADSVIVKSETVINTAIASTLAIGHASVLYFAMLLQQLPFALISLSLSTVMLKEFAEKQAQRDAAGSRRLITSGINWNVFLLLPVSMLMFVLAEPLVRLLFEYKRFTPEDTRLTAFALQCYSIGLVGWGVQALLGRVYAARLEMKQAVAINLGAVALNVVASLSFVKLGMASAGIALGTSVAFLANAGFRVWHVNRNLRREGAGYELADIAPSFLKALAAAVAGGFVAFLVYQTLEGFSAFGRVGSRLVLFLLPAASGTGFYAVMSMILRSAEMDEITARFLRLKPQSADSANRRLDVNLYCVPPRRLLTIVEANADLVRHQYNLAGRVADFLKLERPWQERNIGVKLIGKLKLVPLKMDLLRVVTDSRPAPLLHRMLGGDFASPGFMRRNAVESLIALDTVDEAVEDVLLKALSDPYFEVRSAAAKAIAKFAPRFSPPAQMKALGKLEPMLTEKNFEVVTAVVQALQAVAFDASVLDLFEKLHHHENWKVRTAVVRSYVELYKRGVVEDAVLLTKRLEDVLATCEAFNPTFELKEELHKAKKALDPKTEPKRIIIAAGSAEAAT